MIGSRDARDALQGARPVPRWALALPLLVVLIAAAVAVAMITEPRPSKTPSVSGGLARVGGPAPAFTSWDLGGKKVSLADFNGRPVLVTFWATWCTACRQELPALQRIRDDNQSTGLGVIAVNYRESNNAAMSAYLAGLQVDLLAVIDPEGAIASAYGVDIGLPITILIDRNGTVAQILIGASSSPTLESAAGRITEAAPAP